MPGIVMFGSEEDGSSSRGSACQEDTDDKSKITDKIANRLDELLEGQERILAFLQLQQECRELGGQTGLLVTASGKSTSAPVASKSQFNKNKPRTMAFERHGVGWGLPPSWPRCLKVREVELSEARASSCRTSIVLSRLIGRQELMESEGELPQAASDASMSGRASDRLTSVAGAKREDELAGWLHAFHPYGKIRTWWDEASCLVLAYEMVMIPIVMAWDMQLTNTLRNIAYATVSFWMGDLVLNFLTGYCKNGVIVVKLRAVVRRYLRGWFTLDFIVLFVNLFTVWSDRAQSGDTPHVQPTGVALIRISKVARLLRIVSSMRMLTIGEKLHRLAQRHLSNDVMALLEIASLLLILAYASHVFACCWFAISKNTYADTHRSWVSSRVPDSEQTYSEAPMGHQYTTAYHWALSQMSSGAMGLQAENTHERVFNVAVLLVGVVLSSIIVSRLTARVAEHSALKSKQSRYVASLQNYLRKTGVDHKLVIAASLQAKARLISMEQSSFDPVVALDLVSASLRAMLKNEMFFINWHQAFFQVWNVMEGSNVAKSVMRFSSFATFAKDDTVFEAASVATSSYLVVRGNLVYSQTPETALVEEPCCFGVAGGSFLAEAALYCDWIHVGTAVVVDTADVLSVDVGVLLEEIQKSSVVSKVYNEIASAFSARVQRPADLKPPPSDVCIPRTAPADLFPSLPRTALDVISLSAIQALRERHRKQSRLFGPFSTHFEHYCQDLQKQVLTGLCMMIPYGDGSVQRIAQVVTVKLHRQDGRFLVHLGSIQAGGVHTFEVKVELPGCKRAAGEIVDEVVAHIMASWLRPFANSLVGETFLTDSADSVSKKNEHNVLITYQRTCKSATLTCNACEGVVHLTAEGPHCTALHIEDAVLLARRPAKGKEVDDVEYSLWAWMFLDEYDALQADDASSELTAAVEEFTIPKAAFEHAKDHYDRGEASSLTGDDRLFAL